MNCQRCEGLMVQDYFYDVQESFGETWVQGWRCLCCGEIVDPLIQAHRLVQSVEMAMPVEEVVQEMDFEVDFEEYPVQLTAS